MIQAQIYKWYHNTYCTKNNEKPHVIFAVPNGGLRSKSEAMTLKATGVVAGVSDMIIISPNKIFFIEVKTETGKQSPDQKDFEQKVKSMGYDYFLVRSLDQFKAIINENT
jgi:hypothetical protein